MNPDMDKQDHGPDIEMIGRWSVTGDGTGVCIFKTDNQEAIDNWILNWTAMCDITIKPCLDDMTARKIISSKPMFQMNKE